MPDISYRIVFGSACGTIFLFGGSRCGTMRNLTPLRKKTRLPDFPTLLHRPGLTTHFSFRQHNLRTENSGGFVLVFFPKNRLTHFATQKNTSLRLALIAVPTFRPDPRRLTKDSKMFANIANSCNTTAALTSASYISIIQLCFEARNHYHRAESLRSDAQTWQLDMLTAQQFSIMENPSWFLLFMRHFIFIQWCKIKHLVFKSSTSRCLI